MEEKIRTPSARALDRERLDSQLRLSPGERRVVLVVAPAGSGKTTLAARLCARADFPIAWFQADAGDHRPDRLLEYLDAAFARVLPSFGVHRCVDDLVAELDRSPRPVGLVIDDLHTIHGTPAEVGVERLVRYFPREGLVVLASRRTPSFDVSRLRLRGELVELDSEAMRFRTWEVEQLFRDVYDAPLPPNDLAALARRTGGWAAGLQLFHLATTGKPASVRRATLQAVSKRSRLVRDYLTRNVLEDLSAQLRQFLLETCVLPVLTPELCDALRGTTGSGAMLAELHRRHIFTSALDDYGTYRYHEVFRSHLEGILVDELGEAALRERFRRAGDALAAAAQHPDAIAAYARAGAVDRVADLIRDAGSGLAHAPGDWISALPACVAENDPWVTLAAARWHLRAGRGADAHAAYSWGVKQFGSEPSGEIFRTERAAVLAFAPTGTGLDRPRPDRWDHVLRAATHANPGSFVDPIDHDPASVLVAGLAAMLAGWPGRAVPMLERIAEAPHASPMVAAAARLAAAVAPHFAPGSPPAGHRLTAVAGEIEGPGGPWLLSMATAALALMGPERSSSWTEPLTPDEPWSALLSRYVRAVGRVERCPDDTIDEFEAAAKEARVLRSGTLEAWCRAGAAYAAAGAGSPHGRELAYAAEAAARSAGVPGARAVAFASLAAIDPSDDHVQLAKASADECGLHIAIPSSLTATKGGETTLRCLGGLRLVVDGVRIDVGRLKPRWRSLLGLLAIHAGRAVHRDTILAALWPDADEAAGRRSLQVSISGIRSCLDAGRRGASLIARVGDAYELRLPDSTVSDLATLTGDLAAGREALRRGDSKAAVGLLQGAVQAYEGPLLPEEGAAEWVVRPRERVQLTAVEAAADLARALLDLDDPVRAERAADAGLGIDRYRDDLWKLRLAALDRAGDRANLEQVRSAYQKVLAELGL